MAGLVRRSESQTQGGGLSAQLNNDLLLRIKLYLDAWAAWAREPSMGLGFSSISAIWRCMHYGLQGAAIRTAYNPQMMIPAHISSIDKALTRLSKMDMKAYQAVRQSHVKKANDYRLAVSLGMGRSEFRKARREGYDILCRLVEI